MSTPTELLAALQAATGPSRELDAAIFRYIGLTEAQERHARSWCRMDRRTDLTRDDFIRSWAPAFTSSLDDALTLVPEGWIWQVSTERHASYLDYDAHSYVSDRHWADPNAGHGVCYEGHADTPALALVIAAIRARGEG